MSRGNRSNGEDSHSRMMQNNSALGKSDKSLDVVPAPQPQQQGLSSEHQTCSSVLRCMENLPIIGHIMALTYVAKGRKDKAKRAGIKATVGVIMAPVNFPAEIVDELARKRSDKLVPLRLGTRLSWMKEFRYRTIRSLCLPASHLNGAHLATAEGKKHSGRLAGWSSGHKFDVDMLMNGGVRFFELPIVHYNNEIYLQQRGTPRTRLEKILTSVKHFVASNKSEIIALYFVADESTSDFPWPKARNVILEVLKNRMIPENMRNLYLGDWYDHGKNIIIFGVPELKETWRNIETHWPDVQWPNDLHADMYAKIEECNATPDNTLMVWYKAECTPTQSMAARGFGGLPGLIAARWADEKFDFADDLGAAVNATVLDVLGTAPRLPFNILSVDFIADELIARIIDLNSVPTATGATDLNTTYLNASMSRSALLMNMSMNRSGMMASSALNRSNAVAGEDFDDDVFSAGLSSINSNSIDVMPRRGPAVNVCETSI